MNLHTWILPFLVTALISPEVFGEWADRIAARAECGVDQKEAICLDCKTLLDCDKNFEVDCTANGLVCGWKGGEFDVASCFSSLDSYDIQNNTASNYICHCRGPGGSLLLGDGNYQDPFDANHYVQCVGGTPSYAECAAGEIFIENDGQCVRGIDCSANNETGQVEIPLACGTYYDCEDDGRLKNCPLNEIFVGGLQICDNPMAGNICLNQSTFTFFPHPDACYIGVMCEDSTTILNTHCCDYGEMFTTECVPIDDTICVAPSLCIQYYMEQNVCNECTDASTTYPTYTPCSEYYFQCQDDGSGGFEPELVKCPDSFPIFNQDGNYCDEAANCIP